MLYNSLLAVAMIVFVYLTFYFIVPIVVYLTVKMYWNAKFQAFSESFLEASAKSPVLVDLLKRIAQN